MQKKIILMGPGPKLNEVKQYKKILNIGRRPAFYHVL